MSNELSLDEEACLCGIRLTSSRLCLLERDLEEELASIRAYPDALEATTMLQAAVVGVTIFSNLAKPYSFTIKQILLALDGYVFSHQAGAMNPQSHHLSKDLQHARRAAGQWFQCVRRVVMIGDSPRCDRDGPRQVGSFRSLLQQPSGFPSPIDFARAINE